MELDQGLYEDDEELDQGLYEDDAELDQRLYEDDEELDQGLYQDDAELDQALCDVDEELDQGLYEDDLDDDDDWSGVERRVMLYRRRRRLDRLPETYVPAAGSHPVCLPCELYIPPVLLIFLFNGRCGNQLS